MLLRRSASTAADLKALAEAVATLLDPGDVVILAGDLGAGKTTFVQGAAAGLGVTTAVTSPTFTLVRQYRGRAPVFHVDVYRLERIQEVIDLGFEEMIDSDGITLVEWGDAVDSLLPADVLRIELIAGDNDERTVTLESSGGSWEERAERLEKATERWREPG